MKFRPELPPPNIPPDLYDYLWRQFNRLEEAVDVLYNGNLAEFVEPPGGEGQLITCTGQYYDFGDGVGVYARIDGQWYKLSATPVARATPMAGSSRLSGGTPTVV